MCYRYCCILNLLSYFFLFLTYLFIALQSSVLDLSLYLKDGNYLEKPPENKK